MVSAFSGYPAGLDGADLLSPHRFVNAMLRFEAALAKTQAAEGLIPQEAAVSIVGTCKAELFDTEKLFRDSVRCANLALPLVKQLRDMVGIFNPAAVPFVHWGASYADVQDAAMAIVTSNVLEQIRSDLNVCVRSLLALGQAQLHAPLASPAAALKCVEWAAPLVRSLSRMQVSEVQALQIHWGAVNVTPAPMRNQREAVNRLLADEVGLASAQSPRNAQRDTWSALGCEIGMMVFSLGTMARDIMHLSRLDAGEVQESDDGLTNSCLVSTMMAAQRMPLRVAALLSILPPQMDGAWSVKNAEQSEWTQLLASAQASARAMCQITVELSWGVGCLRSLNNPTDFPGDDAAYAIVLAAEQLDALQRLCES